MKGKAIFVTDDDDEPFRSGSSWETGSIELVYGRRDSVRMGWGIGVGGFKASSSVPVSSGFISFQGLVDLQVIAIQAWNIWYLTEPGRKSRVFIQSGGAYVTMEMEVTASTGGFSVSQSDTREKWGVGAGIGIHHRVSKRTVILGRMRYLHVFGTGTVDPSMFTVTVGVGLGG